MKRKGMMLTVIHGILWAAAIVASATLKAPTTLTLVLLPILGFASVAAIDSTLREAKTCL